MKCNVMLVSYNKLFAELRFLQLSSSSAFNFCIFLMLF